jgi:hypothetical protein
MQRISLLPPLFHTLVFYLPVAAISQEYPAARDLEIVADHVAIVAQARTGRAAGLTLDRRQPAAARFHARKPWRMIGCFDVLSGSPIQCHVVKFRVYLEDDFLPQWAVHRLQLVEVLRQLRQLQPWRGHLENWLYSHPAMQSTATLPKVL